jgi:hypothetical protein
LKVPIWPLLAAFSFAAAHLIVGEFDFLLVRQREIFPRDPTLIVGSAGKRNARVIDGDIRVMVDAFRNFLRFDLRSGSRQ